MYYKRVIKNYSQKEKKLSRVFILILLVLFSYQFISSKISNYFEEKRQDMYTEYIPENFIGINPLFENLNNSNSDLSKLLYKGLVTINPETKEITGDLADFIVNDNSTEFKFILKTNQKWSNGKDITNQDILFTFNQLIKGNNFENKLLQSNFQGVEIIENQNNEIVFQLDKPNNFFLSNLTIGILPAEKSQEFLEKTKFIKEAKCELCIFSGDYELQDIITQEQSTEIILKSENNTLKNIRFLISKDNSELQEQAHSNFYSNNNDRYYLLPKYTALFLNNSNQFLKNINLRKAIKNTLNKQDLQIILEDKIMINSPYFQYETLATELPEQANVDQIKEELSNKGFEYREDILFYNSKPVRLGLILQKYEINVQKNQENQILKDFIQNKFQEIGIQIVPYFYDKDTFQELLLGKNYDLAIFGHDLGNNLDSYSFWHSTQTFPGGLNISNYQNLLTDKLLENLRKNNSTKKQIQLVKELNKDLNKNIPAVFLFTDKQGFKVDNKIKNRKILESYTKPSDRFFDINLWTINNI